MWGRNAESPVPVIAASTPGGCFDAAIEAARIALKYRTPVFLLSDAYLANGSEPWLIPDLETYPEIPVDFADAPNHEGGFRAVPRDAETSAYRGRFRDSGLEHRIGGLEGGWTGNVSYDPDNYIYMVLIRACKVAGIAADIPDFTFDEEGGEELLVLSRHLRAGGRRRAPCAARAARSRTRT